MQVAIRIRNYILDTLLSLWTSSSFAFQEDTKQIEAAKARGSFVSLHFIHPEYRSRIDTLGRLQIFVMQETPSGTCKEPVVKSVAINTLTRGSLSIGLGMLVTCPLFGAESPIPRMVMLRWQWPTLAMQDGNPWHLCLTWWGALSNGSGLPLAQFFLRVFLGLKPLRLFGGWRSCVLSEQPSPLRW